VEPDEIADWALAHGFRKTGHAAYSAWHEGWEYQILLRRDYFFVNRISPSGWKHNHVRTGYEHVRINEFDVLENLTEAFVRAMWNDDADPPPWFTPEFIEHAREVMIPTWESRVARYR
jgi:hypothetical protein